MSKYGEVALRAAELAIYDQGLPYPAWMRAIEEIMTTKSNKEKGCPRSAFLGLCEAGLVRGIKAGNYTSSKKNKLYALTAIEILKRQAGVNAELLKPKVLWAEVITELNIEPISHNHQMEVVIALYKNGFINC